MHICIYLLLKPHSINLYSEVRKIKTTVIRLKTIRKINKQINLLIKNIYYYYLWKRNFFLTEKKK